MNITGGMNVRPPSEMDSGDAKTELKHAAAALERAASRADGNLWPYNLREVAR